MAGDGLNEMSLSQAIKLLQQGKEEKAIKDKPSPTQSQPETNGVGNPTSEVNTSVMMADMSNTTSKEEEVRPTVEEDDKESPIGAPPPFDLPGKRSAGCDVRTKWPWPCLNPHPTDE